MKNFDNQDKEFIKRCIELSDEALSCGDNPFGSVISRGGDIIAEARNEISNNDVTMHAEIVAMKKVQKLLGSSDLSDCVIYSNCEPCPMCSFMMRELKFRKVVFALKSPYMGGHSKWNILEDQGLIRFKPVFSNPPEVIAGLLEDEAREIFKKAGWSLDEA